MPTRRRPLPPSRPRRGRSRSRPPRLLDITRPLGPHTIVYPGDPPVRLTLALDPERGDSARVTRLETGAHAGTHVDAPCHLDGLSGGVETLALEALMGPVQVRESRGGVVGPADVARIPAGSPRRILFRGAPVLAPSAARALVRAGFVLVGTDGLSIDPVDAADLPAHRVLLRAGVVILEALDLELAKPGRYDLVALPLLLAGSDGAPARVILRR